MICASPRKAIGVPGLAEGVGFEPTYRLSTDNSISSRARYGRFATPPQCGKWHKSVLKANSEAEGMMRRKCRL